MNKALYRGHRFPKEIISHCVWLYFRFSLSYRDVQEMMAERGVLVSHEAIRNWGEKFGREYARRLRQRRGRLGDTWHLDEVFVKIGGRQHYLWRAVDQDGSLRTFWSKPSGTRWLRRGSSSKCCAAQATRREWS
jgi:putative transposase